MDCRCPLKLTQFPSEPCELGKNLFQQPVKPFCRCRNSEFNQNDPELLNCKHCGKMIVKCNWGIDSEEHNYCVWKFLNDSKQEISDNDIGQKLGLTTQRVGQIKKKSYIFLQQIAKKEYKD